MRPQNGENKPQPTDNSIQPPSETPHGDTSFAGEVERWRRRGYTVRYDDGLLVQLSRRETFSWRMLLLLALALGALGLAGTLLWLAWRGAQRWSVISLTQAPDQRIITHRLLTDRPPTDGEAESE